MEVKHYLTALKIHYDKRHQRDQQKSKVDKLGWSTAMRMVEGVRVWAGSQRGVCHGAGCDHRFGKRRLGHDGMCWSDPGALEFKVWRRAGNMSRGSGDVWVGHSLGDILGGCSHRTDCCVNIGLFRCALNNTEKQAHIEDSTVSHCPSCLDLSWGALSVAVPTSIHLLKYCW